MMNNTYNSVIEILQDKTFRLTAERLIIRLGVRADLRGYECLIDAIILFATDCCSGFCEIYETIGSMRGIKAKSVMREISYAIAQSYEIAQKLSEMIGSDIDRGDIHSGLVIAFLGKIFKNPDLSVYA